MSVARAAVGLEGSDVVSLYLGDVITLGSFRARSVSGDGVFVGPPDDRRVGDCGTFVAFVLDSIGEVRRFLGRLAR